MQERAMVWTKIVEMKRSKWTRVYLEGKMGSNFWLIRYEFEKERGVQNKNRKTLSKFLFWAKTTVTYFLKNLAEKLEREERVAGDRHEVSEDFSYLFLFFKMANI